MAFIKPQLASPSDEKSFARVKADPTQWVMEEKLDGHRLIVEVRDEPADLLSESKRVVAWSRNGKPFNNASKGLPPHLEEQLGWLPVGIYDGEVLVPGHRSYGVTELFNADRLVFVCFDVLEIKGTNVRDLALFDRRRMLGFIFEHPVVAAMTHIKLVPQYDISMWARVEELRDDVWARDGEGLILKRRTSYYVAGKRSKDWIKIKQERTAVLRVVGWEVSRGKLVDRGDFAIVLLEDDNGNRTTVKTKDDATLVAIAKEAAEVDGPPFIGRQLRIDYQERTPDGLYRHPRWDRWENE
jgi:bifunctional non-homologous end joining protein LigD